jgi:NADH pyrophosphatase NudC (nudix superfamily)
VCVDKPEPRGWPLDIRPCHLQVSDRLQQDTSFPVDKITVMCCYVQPSKVRTLACPQKHSGIQVGFVSSRRLTSRLSAVAVEAVASCCDMIVWAARPRECFACGGRPGVRNSSVIVFCKAAAALCWHTFFHTQTWTSAGQDPDLNEAARNLTSLYSAGSPPTAQDANRRP